MIECSVCHRQYTELDYGIAAGCASIIAGDKIYGHYGSNIDGDVWQFKKDLAPQEGIICDCCISCFKAKSVIECIDNLFGIDHGKEATESNSIKEDGENSPRR